MYSDYFSVTNGVNRVELFLHCYLVYIYMYIDVLFDRLKDSNVHVGCYLDHYYVGCVGYADEKCIMVPSCNAMRIMLNICDIPLAF